MHSESFERVVFWITVLLAGAVVWVAPRLPLSDLPQHAGQIQLWHDLILGTSRWQSLVEVNLFTPYLVGGGLALLLSFVMPVSAALKLLLALSYYAFVLACVALRRELGGDRRLDWLFVTSFFGLAWLYGFFTFLIALPAAVLFMLLALRHARGLTATAAALLVAAGIVLFYSHGLAFVFAGAVGAAFLLLKRRTVRAALVAVVPYVVLGLLTIAYLLWRYVHPGIAIAPPAAPDWPGPLHGLAYLLFFPMGSHRMDPTLAPLVALFLFGPVLMGARIDRRNKAAVVPLVVLLLWLLAMPETFGDTYFAVSRFAVFFLPFYALLFAAPPSPSNGPRAIVAGYAMAALCWGFIAIQTHRLVEFERESADFEEVLAAAEPGYRASQSIGDMVSPAAVTPMAYASFPLWYQVEKGGLVDFNFALYTTQVVRFRDPQAESAPPFDSYRYFFIRSAGAGKVSVPPGACAPVLRRQAGEWWLFEKTVCPRP